MTQWGWKTLSHTDGGVAGDDDMAEEPASRSQGDIRADRAEGPDLAVVTDAWPWDRPPQAGEMRGLAGGSIGGTVPIWGSPDGRFRRNGRANVISFNG